MDFLSPDFQIVVILSPPLRLGAVGKKKATERPNERLLMLRDLWEGSARDRVRRHPRRVAGDTHSGATGVLARLSPAIARIAALVP